jgi:hypothetical protein
MRPKALPHDQTYTRQNLHKHGDKESLELEKLHAVSHPPATEKDIGFQEPVGKSMAQIDNHERKGGFRM